MADMTGRERMRAAFVGAETDHTPVFPCIYIDHASVALGHDYEEAIVDPRKGVRWMLEANLQYGFDVARVRTTPPRSWFKEKEVRRDGDTLVQVDRRTGNVDGTFDVAGGGTLQLANPPEPVVTLEQAAKLTWPGADELIATGCLDAARECTERAHERGLFVVGMAGAQTMNFLVNQVGDSTRAIMLMADEPEFVRRMFEIGTSASIELIKAFARIRVDCIYIGDSYSSGSVISPRMYHELCTPCYQRAADAAHAAGLLVYKHCCGNYNPLLELVTQDHLDGMEGIDPTREMTVARTREAVGQALCLIGGVSCLSLLNGTPDEVYAEARRCIEQGGPRKYVLGSACAVPRFSPPENLRALARAARAK